MNSLSTFVEIPSRSARRVASRARRADRMPALLGLKADANAVLDKLSVMIVGTGAVGATTARSLAHLFVGELRLVDRGQFKLESLSTQPITPADVGQPKARAVGRLCKNISPRTRVLIFAGALQQLALADMVGVHVVIVAGDNLSVLREAGERCQHLGLPLIHAAIHGESLIAQCSAYGNAVTHSPCPVCRFGPEEFQMMDEERTLSCEGFRNPAALANGRSLQSTMSLRPLCALAGEMAALQSIRLALRLGPPIENTLLEVCAYTWRSHVTPLLRNPKCPCAHERYEVQPMTRSLDACSITQLVRTARLSNSAAEKASLNVEDFRWVERGLCGCAESQPVNRLVRTGRSHVRHCAKCAQLVQPQPFYSHDSFPIRLMAPFRDQSLRSLGAAGCRGVLVRHGDKTILLTNPRQKARS